MNESFNILGREINCTWIDILHIVPLNNNYITSRCVVYNFQWLSVCRSITKVYVFDILPK